MSFVDPAIKLDLTRVLNSGVQWKLSTVTPIRAENTFGLVGRVSEFVSCGPSL